MEMKCVSFINMFQYQKITYTSIENDKDILHMKNSQHQ